MSVTTERVDRDQSSTDRPATARRHLNRACSAAAVAAVQVLCLGMPVGYAQDFGQWGPAVSVDAGRTQGVNTPANDGCPIEAPDDHILFFASDRAGGLDVWVAYRTGEEGPWGSAEKLPFPVNTPASEFCPTPLPGNRLLFVSTRSALCGGAPNNADIYYTRLHPVRGWLPPQHLGCEVNSGFDEFSPSLVEVEGATMLFFSSSRGDGVHHKIYVSLLLDEDLWGPATLVSELNAPGAQDARPNVRKDGLEIVFDSTRDGGPAEIYTATRSTVFEPWSQPERLSSNVNSNAHAETRPSLSRDGRRLYFGSTRANQSGDHGGDIYVSTRSGPGPD